MSDTESPNAAIRDLTFGSIAGMTAKLYEHPFDLLKVRLQSQATDRPLVYKGPLDCLQKTVRSEGWLGLYRGLSPPVLGAALENASLFVVYNRCQAAIKAIRPGPGGGDRELTTGELAVAGAGAGAVTSFILTPIELIKCRMQVQMIAGSNASGAAQVVKTTLSAPASPSSTVAVPAMARPLSTAAARPKGPFALIADTVRTSGLRGLWLGQTGTFFRETGGSAAWFGAYELVARAFVRRRQAALDAADPTHAPHTLAKGDLAPWQLMVAGACGGVAYNVSLFPADSVKSAMQTSAELHPERPPPKFLPTLRMIWHSRGFRGLYAGCGLTCLRSGPSSAIIFGLFETLNAKFAWVFDGPGALV